MNKERLAVANKISKQLDTIALSNDAIRFISENSANATMSFSLYVRTEKNEEASISSSLLGEFGLNLEDLKTSIISQIESEIGKKYSELESKFANDEFDTEEKG